MKDDNNNGTVKIKMTRPERHEDTVGYLIDALKEIAKNPNHGYPDEEVERLKRIENEILVSTDALSNNIRKMTEDMQKGIEAFINYTKAISHPIIAKLQKASEKGWYVSPNVFSSLPMSELDDLLSQDSLDEFEIMLLENSDNNVADVLERCSESFPQNQAVFNEIQQLIKNGFYRASIMMAYSMADSMCNTKWGFGFFDKDKLTGYNLKMFDKLEDMEESMSSLIRDQLSIAKNEITQYSKHPDFNDPIKKAKSFNRHLIIHGHSVEYGTKKNAVRAIYLLDFIEYFSRLEV